ncbi:epimerase [Gracilibacillus salinarum]|uniref:Epimerase n=1 Tax=Gracilibacillus salinarum TaxID=2932255 RepID=A0ABY4GKG2_9BACI|nr:epimerase [Gracilibacillus salinarum]UOQ84714.1 epimerase [Gracilibacillus salinarum]
MKPSIALGATVGTGQVYCFGIIEQRDRSYCFRSIQSKLNALMVEHDHYPKLTVKQGDIFDYQTIIKVADTLGKKIVFVDEIYVYGHQVAKGDESHPHQPHTKKDKIRVEFGKLIFSSKWRRAEALIVRLAYYYGPTSQDSYLQPTLEGRAANKITIFIGNLKTPREYVYLPDATRMIVDIAVEDDSYGENWNIPGSELISGKEIIKIARQITGSRKLIIPLTKNAIRFIGLFDLFMREIVEIMYLTKEGFILSGEKYEKRIGIIPKTSFKKGLEETLTRLMRVN